MGEELLGNSPTKTISETFNEVLPYYLSIGMTYDQFWYGEADLVVYYRKANNIKREYDNQQAWLLGAYVYNAVSVSLANSFGSGKGHSYLKEPFPISYEEIEERKKSKEEEAKAQAKAWMDSLVNSYKHLGG